MIRLQVEHAWRVLECLLSLRAGWHARRLGWVISLDGEPVEWFRTLSGALDALREM